MNGGLHFKVPRLGFVENKLFCCDGNAASFFDQFKLVWSRKKGFEKWIWCETNFLNLNFIQMLKNRWECFKKYQILTSFLFLAEHDFSIYPASNIAAAAIAASLSGLNWHVRSRISIYELMDKLAELSESESVS